MRNNNTLMSVSQSPAPLFRLLRRLSETSAAVACTKIRGGTYPLRSLEAHPSNGARPKSSHMSAVTWIRFRTKRASDLRSEDYYSSIKAFVQIPHKKISKFQPRLRFPSSDASSTDMAPTNTNSKRLFFISRLLGLVSCPSNRPIDWCASYRYLGTHGPRRATMA